LRNITHSEWKNNNIFIFIRGNCISSHLNISKR